MAEIEITLPTVQYGNVKVRATPEELGMDLSDAGAIGHGVAIYLNLFQQGFKAGSGADVDWSPSEPSGASQGASQGVTEAQARRMLDEGLGGVTEVDIVIEETVAKAAEIEAKAPWDKPAAEVKKPWEAEATAPKAVVSSDW